MKPMECTEMSSPELPKDAAAFMNALLRDDASCGRVAFAMELSEGQVLRLTEAAKTVLGTISDQEEDGFSLRRRFMELGYQLRYCGADSCCEPDEVLYLLDTDL